MNGTMIMKDCQILRIEKGDTNDPSIIWYQCLCMQGNDISKTNIITIDKAFQDKKFVGLTVDLVVQVSEHTRNNFKTSKFKIIDLLKDGHSIKPVEK